MGYEGQNQTQAPPEGEVADSDIGVAVFPLKIVGASAAPARVVAIFE